MLGLRLRSEWIRVRVTIRVIILKALYGLINFLFLSTAHSLKCYKCTTSSEEECTANQTIIECANNQQCATVKYSNYGQTYLKTCLPPTFPCSTFRNASGQVKECSIDFCSSDYCNGPVPTTPTPVPGTSPSEVTTEQTTSKKEKVTSAGSVSSSASGLIALVFLFAKILQICTVS